MRNLFLLNGGLFTFATAFITAETLIFPLCYEDGVTMVTHTKRGLVFSHHKAEHHLQADQQRIEELSQKREPKVVEYYKEKLTILKYALSQYSCPKEGEDVPESVIEAFFTKIVVAEDGFHWYIRVTGDPDKPLHCKVEGKRRSTTKIVVTQDFSPALDSSTTCGNQRTSGRPL